MSLNENIKIYRQQKKISQRELGRRINKTGQLISSIERGETTPSIDTIEKIAKSLNVDVLDLLGPFNPVDYIDEEDKDALTQLGYIQNNQLISGINIDNQKSKTLKDNKVTLSPNDFKDEEFNKLILQLKKYFLSNPLIQDTFNYSFNKLLEHNGCEKLLVLAIEKAIRTTLEDIRMHLENGDIFVGNCSWIPKDSPFYKIIKNHDNPPNHDDDEFL